MHRVLLSVYLLIIGITVNSCFAQNCNQKFTIKMDSIYVSKYDNEIFLGILTIQNYNNKKIFLSELSGFLSTSVTYEGDQKVIGNKNEKISFILLRDPEIDMNDNIYSPFAFPSILLSDSAEKYQKYYNEWDNRNKEINTVKKANHVFYIIPPKNHIKLYVKFQISRYELLRLRKQTKLGNTLVGMVIYPIFYTNNDNRLVTCKKRLIKSEDMLHLLFHP